MISRVEDSIRQSAGRFGDRTALVAGGRRLSFAEIDADSDRLAARLLREGVRRGDRVGLFMDNSWEMVVGLFAVLKAGAAFMPVNPSVKADKLAFLLQNSGARALLTQARLLSTAAEAVAASPETVLTVAAQTKDDADTGAVLRFEEALSEPLTQALPPAGIGADLAMLLYTSGSTGAPKGVMMAHDNMLAATRSVLSYLHHTPDDVVLNVLPLSHGYGLYQVLMGAEAGFRVVLEKSFAFPAAILAKMAEEEVTGFPLIPTMAAMIAGREDLEPGFLPSLRQITNAAAALPPALVARLRLLFPQAKIYAMYGQTECKRGTYLEPSEVDRRPGSVGKAIPGSEVWLIREDGSRAGPGETGELVIRGPHVMKGYWKDEAATARALRPGPMPWERVLHTGDLFRTDAEGYLFFVSRKDDIIKTRGEKVSPQEVEAVLYAMPGVREAAVIGAEDALLGQVVKAIVALDDGVVLEAKDVIRHCARHLEDFMVPKFVEFRAELPKTDTGKITMRHERAPVVSASRNNLEAAQ